MKKITLLAGSLMMMAACNNTPDYDATGIFEATTVTISAETSGKILSFAPSEGDIVEQGETIAVIDTTLLVIQLKQIESQHTATKTSMPDISAQAKALRAQIDHARQECDRISRLLADGAATQKQYDDAQAQYNTLQGQLTALLSTLNKNRGTISDNAIAVGYQAEFIEEQIAKSVITSPLSGTVLVKYAEAGEFATPGRPLCKVADMNKIYLRAYFTAAQLADLKLGQHVTVIADFGGDEQYEYPGTIMWIAEESEFTPKSIQTKDSRANLVYAVKIAVKNDGRLKLGQYGEVRL